MRSPGRTLRVCGILALTTALATGCQALGGGRSLLGDPPKDQAKLSSYEPAEPYRQLAPLISENKLV
jgi:hypothetical protein